MRRLIQRSIKPTASPAGLWAVGLASAVTAILVAALVLRSTSGVRPAASPQLDPGGIADAERNDPRVTAVAAAFRCPCGGCGEMNLVDCRCEMPRGALEVKTRIIDLLRTGTNAEDVGRAIASQYPGAVRLSSTAKSHGG